MSRGFFFLRYCCIPPPTGQQPPAICPTVAAAFVFFGSYWNSPVPLSHGRSLILVRARECPEAKAEVQMKVDPG
jgi:hypothetical protein